MRSRIVVLLFVLSVATVAWAQTTVKANQGAPGTQGCWPVCTSGSTTIRFDGGFFGSVVVIFDGGYLGTTAPVACRVTAQDGGAVEQNTVVGGTTSVQVPGSPSTGRVYVNVCNSAQNASTDIVKCRADGVAPVFAPGNAGDVLLFGDCVLYTVPPSVNSVRCIANDAGINATSYECVPF